MGDVIALDYTALLNVMELYNIKDIQTFENVLMCYNLEQEFGKVQE